MNPVPKRLLTTSLVVGGAFDLALALAILYFPATLAALAELTLPAEMIYLDLAAVLLVSVALYQFVAARALEQVPSLASVAAAGRLLGFFLFVAAWHSGHPATLLWAGIWFLALAIAHAGLLLWGLMADRVGDAETA